MGRHWCRSSEGAEIPAQGLMRQHLSTSLVVQMVKRLPTMWETQVQSLGRGDLLEKGMATHSSILPAIPTLPPKQRLK